jgi:hypothetical protein
MSRIEHETDINAPVEFMNTIQIQTISKKHGQEMSSKNQNQLRRLKMNQVLR